MSKCLQTSAEMLPMHIAPCVVSNTTLPLAISAEDVLKNQHLYVTCGVLCTVIDDNYLRVTPNTIWLASGILDSAEFNIYANVTWEIK